jgi:hypothetical protein
VVRDSPSWLAMSCMVFAILRVTISLVRAIFKC